MGKVIVGLHKDQNGSFDLYTQIYERILNHNNIKCLRIEASTPDFWEVVARLDLVVFHWVYIDRDQQMGDVLIPIIEKELGIKCFPNWHTFWHYNYKIKQYYLLKAKNLPVIDSYIFWEYIEAIKWIETAEYPLIFKLNRGALSADVILVKNKSQAIKLASLMFGKGVKPGNLPKFQSFSIKEEIKKIRQFGYVAKQILKREYIGRWWQKEKGYVFFQKFLPDNRFTTRINIIGNRAFGFNIITAKGDFRSYDMQNIDYDLSHINLECVNMAFRISNALKFQCMAYDFLFDEEGQPFVCEIGYTSQAYDIYKCKGFWDPCLNWHDGNFWPQYCQLVDLLCLPDLEQPPIEFITYE